MSMAAYSGVMPARITDVRVRALLDEQRRDIVVRVDHRDVQRRRSVGVHRVEIGAGLGKRAHTGAGPLPSRQHQCGHPATRQRREHHRRRIDLDLRELRHLRTHVQVGAARGQQRDDRGVIFGGRPHQRGLSMPRFARVHVCTAIKQRAHRLRPARAGREHQHGIAVGAYGIGVRSGLQQRIDDRRAAVDRGQRQRRHRVAVLRVDLRAGANERLHELETIEPSGPVQRRRSVGLGRVHQRTLPRQRLHGRGVAIS